MIASERIFALAGGLVAVLAAASLAQQPAAPGATAPGETLVVGGEIGWIEESDVAALREGVIRQVEFRLHDRVEQGEPIGYLRDEMAKLNEAKAEVAANSVGAIQRAEAQKLLAMSRLARLKNLAARDRDYVSPEEMRQAEAELAVALASVQEATEARELARAELALAKQAVEEHVITAPFTGFITDLMKYPGEWVQANEAVVHLGRIDRLRFHGYVPLESAYRIREGDLVEVRATVEGADLPVEHKVFRGNITGLSREVVVVGRNDVQVVAEIRETDDPDHPELSLRPGMKAEMTIHLGSAGGSAPAPVATNVPSPPAR